MSSEAEEDVGWRAIAPTGPTLAHSDGTTWTSWSTSEWDPVEVNAQDLVGVNEVGVGAGLSAEGSWVVWDNRVGVVGHQRGRRGRSLYSVGAPAGSAH